MKIRRLISSFIVLVLALAMSVSMASCDTNASTKDTGDEEKSTTAAPVVDNGKTPGKITLVWYPNESAADYQPAREEFGRLITQATGKQVEQKLTTDYAIAIEALAGGTAQICFMGAQGYIEACNRSKDVKPLFVNSGVSGTLDDAIYYSWLCVNKGEEEGYLDGGEYSIANIIGKKMSFVSNSSTSGFKVPTNGIMNFFSTMDEWKDITSDDLIEGGKDMFFSEVLFGGSHQGSAVNLLSGKADVAAFCDTELAPYSDIADGEENTAGAIYEVKADASAPFDTLAGKQFVIIKSTPVLNGPFAYNSSTLSAEDVTKIQELFTSEEVSSNDKIFVIKDSGNVGMFKKTDKECFLLVEDSWFNPIREMK